MDRGASWATAHGMAKSWTPLGTTTLSGYLWFPYRPHTYAYIYIQTHTCVHTKPSRTHCSFHCDSNGAWSSSSHLCLQKLAKASLKRRDGVNFSCSCRHKRKGAFQGRELRVQSQGGRKEPCVFQQWQVQLGSWFLEEPGGGGWGEAGEDDPREAVGGQVHSHRGPASFIWQLLLMTPPPLSLCFVISALNITQTHPFHSALPASSFRTSP